MKPLIIAADIVQFSLNQRASLKAAVREFFAEALHDGDHPPHTLPSGDGAILVWQWDVENDPEPVVVHRVIAGVLTRLGAWSQRTGAQVRVGIHCDVVESIQILGQASLFGQGISECVRHETAADPNQALISRSAKEHLEIPRIGPELVLGEPFPFFDKHGKRHAAVAIGPSGNSHWQLEMPASAQETAVRAELRTKEMPANNSFLETATDATVVAMTCKTLGAALIAKRVRPVRLQRAEICVFAVPALRHGHPTLRHNFRALENEWVTGVRDTLRCLLKRDVCPLLERLDLTLISAMPPLTGTVTVRRQDDGDSEALLRYHPVVDGWEPENIPTLIVNRLADEPTPVFIALRSMIENVGTRSLRLTFPIRRAHPRYSRQEIEVFVDFLKKVCNHSGFGAPDREFSAELKTTDPSAAAGPVTPELVHWILGDRRAANSITAVWQVPDDVLTLSRVGCDDGPARRVSEKHLLAYFAVMTWDGCVVLVLNPKSGWSHDVPGGKVSTADRSAAETVRREVFEELGMIIECDWLDGPVGAVYDPRSAKEASSPVVAEYYHLELKPHEFAYLMRVAGATTTRGHAVVMYPVRELLEAKQKHQGRAEAICHAPLLVIEEIARRMDLQRATRGPLRPSRRGDDVPEGSPPAAHPS